ncbi:MAG: RagB/SusD family nutrient uptake outer membrane protein [Saprospiraceae bacterium]
MNKLIKFRSVAILLLALLALPFNSCTDLEPEIFSDLTSENFPRGSGDIIASVASTYTRLYPLQNHGGFWSSIEVASDEIMIPQRGSDWFDGGIWLRQHRHQYLPTEGHLNGAWLFLYQGVLQANNTIKLVNSAGSAEFLTTEEIALYDAEMRSLRALFYYWLTDAFGDVPLITGDEPEVAREPTQNSREEIYNFVISELEAVAGALPNEKSTDTYARFNYAANQALLSRIYLNSEVLTGTPRYEEAARAADNVINTSLFELTDDYFENFVPGNNNGFASTTENILVIPYDQVTATGFNTVQMTNHYSAREVFNLQEQPWNGYCTLQEFYESYDEDDLRRGTPGETQGPGNFLVGALRRPNGDIATDDSAEGTDPDGDEIFHTPEVNELEPNALRQAGARVKKFQFEQGAASSMNNDFPILRYSEVLMNKAEALYRRNNGDGMALMLVNQIRDRAGLDDFDSLNDANLLAERGREHFYEGQRRSDLIRFGQYNRAWFAKPVSDATKNVFPIPQPQINANRNLMQNPGY